ncbi:MAG: serine protease AprX [Actinoplanes sp.]|nr:serine protease AprX [Actinoplanes sp.]
MPVYGSRGAAALLTTATLVAAVALSSGPAFAAPAAVTGPVAAPTGTVPIVVRAGTAAASAAAKTAVRRAGGTLGRDLDLITGFAATVPGASLAALRALPGVEVTTDAPVRMKSDSWVDQVGSTPLTRIIAAVGANKADNANPDITDTKTGISLTGAGVGVALIDSGVAPVQGLTGPGKIVFGPDLSFESQATNLRDLDTYGHGTHMAGIIAGQDPASVTGTAHFSGVAPAATILSVKVAAADGASDVSQVIAGIDWVVAHRNDRGLNIRVLNLSFGTESTQAEILDPLSFAVEQAWNAGIVVVVAAGNDGPAANHLTMPAANPNIIAVGGADTMGTDARADDQVTTFTNRGNASRHVDVIATGQSVVSLRNPGSYIDRTYPTARLSTTADPTQRFFRGSGTSQAAAVVSGSVALLLQQRPGLTPDQVKRLLMNTATPIVGGDPYAAGSGQINVEAAAKAKTPGTVNQLNLIATGLGSLEQSRGGSHVYDSSTGAVLTGEKDIFGKTWNAAVWALNAKQQKTWNGGTWNGSVWAGTTWGGTVSSNQAWAGAVWAGRSWAGSSWAGRSWATAVWTGRSWSAATWSGRSWSGRTWAAAGWPEPSWQ